MPPFLNPTSDLPSPELFSPSPTPSPPSSSLHPPSLPPSLHLAVQSGKPSSIRRLIFQGGSSLLSERDSAGRTALHWAAVFGSEEVAKLLLVNLPRRLTDSTDKYGRTALHYAAGLGKVEVAKALIERGAKVGALDLRHVSPLHLAAENPTVEMVQFLLSKGAQMSAVDLGGRRAADYALRQGGVEAGKLLGKWGEGGDEGARKVPEGKEEGTGKVGFVGGKGSEVVCGVFGGVRDDERERERERERKKEKKTALEELLNAWKGAEKTKKIEKSGKVVRLEEALEEWRRAERERKARGEGDGERTREAAVKAAAETEKMMEIDRQVAIWEQLQSSMEGGRGIGGRVGEKMGEVAASYMLAMALDMMVRGKEWMDATWCTEWEAGGREEGEQREREREWRRERGGRGVVGGMSMAVHVGSVISV